MKELHCKEKGTRSASHRCPGREQHIQRCSSRRAGCHYWYEVKLIFASPLLPLLTKVTPVALGPQPLQLFYSCLLCILFASACWQFLNYGVSSAWSSELMHRSRIRRGIALIHVVFAFGVLLGCIIFLALECSTGQRDDSSCSWIHTTVRYVHLARNAFECKTFVCGSLDLYLFGFW